MRVRSVGVVAVLVAAALVAVLAGCGDSGGGTAAESSATPATTPAAESPAAESPTSDEWTTAVTIRSSDPLNDMGLLVSDEFTVTGEARFVLDMPDGGDTDGVIAALFPADQEITVAAAAEAETVTLPAAFPEQVVEGLDGTYVVLMTVPTTKDWSLEVQTRP